MHAMYFHIPHEANDSVYISFNKSPLKLPYYNNAAYRNNENAYRVIPRLMTNRTKQTKKN